jgi:hypothetical protein
VTVALVEVVPVAAGEVTVVAPPIVEDDEGWSVA